MWKRLLRLSFAIFTVILAVKGDEHNHEVSRCFVFVINFLVEPWGRRLSFTGVLETSSTTLRVGCYFSMQYIRNCLICGPGRSILSGYLGLGLYYQSYMHVD